MSTSPLEAVIGSQGRIVINSGDPLNLTKFTVAARAIDTLTTNFESAAAPFGDSVCEEGVLGIVGCDVSFEGAYDSSAPPFASGLLAPGTTISNVELFIAKGGSAKFTFDELRILSAPVTQDVTGIATISVTAKSNGSFTFPSA